MKIQKKTFKVVLLALGCLAFLPQMRGVSPLPDGCYPNSTTAEGCKALQSLTSGVANTGIGWYSLFATDTGSYNTAVGAGALDLNTADNNTAVGVAALLLNTTGTNNTADGVAALVFNDGGEGNTATGAFALYSNTQGDFNTANGEFSLYFNTTGERNTAIGDSALYLNTEGSRNTAIGNPAMLNNTTGDDNTAIGAGALFSNTADENTAVGAAALSDNTTGGLNTAMGFSALSSNNTGIANTATGWHALFSNTTGQRNTANGRSALESNTEGNFNIALGEFALAENTTGNLNTAIGYLALQINNGSQNTAIGESTLIKNTTGSQNTAIGVTAGSGVTTASDVICIGAAGANVDSSCYIRNIWQQPGGSQAVFVNADGKLGAQVSSRRFKHDVKPMEQSSEVIYRLKPVSFRYNAEIEPTGPLAFGLIAEDVEHIDPDLVTRDKNGNAFSVRYDQVNAMLLNEFLKEHRTVKQQEATIARLEKQVEVLTAGLQKVSAQIEMNRPAPEVAANSQ